MTDISPEAQALADRLVRMDPANPRQDKVTIEQALLAQLEALALPERPFVWVESPRAACRLVAALEAGERIISDAARDDVRRAGKSVMQEKSRAWLEAWSAACNAGGVAIRDATASAWDAVWDSSWSAAWGAACNGEWAAVQAVCSVNGLAAFDHPTAAKVASIWRPMVDAFEAGLFFYWITSDRVICVLQPSMSIENGRLHRADGPAVRWPMGEAYFFWRGVQVPARLIEEPDLITVEAIRSESNQEIRRCMSEIYGLSRYLRDAGARLVHEDGYGRLWEAQVSDETWRIVEVEDGTPGPDGERRVYTLDVTGAAEMLGWPVETAHAAVAATYGLRPDEYSPEVRT